MEVCFVVAACIARAAALDHRELVSAHPYALPPSCAVGVHANSGGPGRYRTDCSCAPGRVAGLVLCPVCPGLHCGLGARQDVLKLLASFLLS